MARRRAVVEENVQPGTDGTEPEVIDFESAPVEVVEEVDVVDDEAEDVQVEAPEATAEGEKPKNESAPKRGDLPEGLITPVAFAKLLSQPIDGNPENKDDSNYRYTHSKTGDHTVAPQMVYSYLKSVKGSKDPNKLTIKDGVVDSNGMARNNILVQDEALAYWDAKNKRTAESKEAAAEKAAKKAEKPAEDTSSTDAEATAAAGEVEEAE